MGNWGYNLILIGLITLLLTLSVPNEGMILKLVGLPSPSWEEIMDDKKQGMVHLPTNFIDCFTANCLFFFCVFLTDSPMDSLPLKSHHLWESVLLVLKMFSANSSKVQCWEKWFHDTNKHQWTKIEGGIGNYSTFPPKKTGPLTHLFETWPFFPQNPIPTSARDFYWFSPADNNTQAI